MPATEMMQRTVDICCDNL